MIIAHCICEIIKFINSNTAKFVNDAVLMTDKISRG